MATLPISFIGGIRYGFNLWSLLGLRPKGLAIFLEFADPLEPYGVQAYTGYVQVQFHPTAGTCFSGSGTIDFEQQTISFVEDDARVRIQFEGRIEPTLPEITGRIRIEGVRDEHAITFRPVPA